MSFLMPVGTEYDGSQSVDSVTFVFADHTATDPHFAIIDRKAPVKKGNVTSMAQYRIRCFRNHVHPVTGEEKKSVLDYTIRYPEFATWADVTADLAWTATLVARTDVKAAVEKLLLPRGSATS